jgi:tetratricopeptide (TPR) repeat protein
MASYSGRQVQEILGLSAGVVASLVEAGFVKPERGARREVRFSFQDLVVLRAAKGLADARLPARRILASLRKLREQLPEHLPSTGLRIAAIGNEVAVMDGTDRWRAADGQYLLAFEVAAPKSELVVLERASPQKSADQWLGEGLAGEEQSPADSIRLYREAIEADAVNAGIYTNLGRLLHEAGKLDEAAKAYREGIRRFPTDATLCFNLAVLLEDQGKLEQAIARYRETLDKNARFADACYNLALLYESTGRGRDALRCFNAFRKMQAEKG